jgi:two-component system chemotaxis response regulator CheB
MNKIKVLVVDDSQVFRQVIAKGLASDKNIEVVATAGDPYEARDKIIEFEPDVMTCDVEMPKMSGIEFIRKLMPQYPLPVVMVSGVNKVVFDAMNAGAVEFVAKPDVQSVAGVESFINELIIKIKIASTVDVSKWKAERHTTLGAPAAGGVNEQCKKIIAIGASTGGTEALYEVLKRLPKDVPGIVAVQHIPPVFSRMFAERLNSTTQLYVKEAVSGDYLECGKVLIAPGDSHLRLKKIGERYKVECFQGDRVNGHCPSVDVLFESVAKEVGSNAIGIILTGMGYDGAKGLLSMRRKGARTIGQDEKTSVVYGMPKVAYDIGGVEKQAPLENIANIILSLLK